MTTEGNLYAILGFREVVDGNFLQQVSNMKHWLHMKYLKEIQICCKSNVTAEALIIIFKLVCSKQILIQVL